MGFVAACKSEGAPAPVSVQNSYSLLPAGVLSGKYRGLDQAPQGSRLELFNGYFERYSGTRAPAAVEAYCELAELHGMTPAALAIAFCDSRPFVTSTIIGARSMAQLEDN